MNSMAGVDRISELPEPILHHILSFLSQKQAIQTSALSKPWRHVGPTRPKIELSESCFHNSSKASFLSVLGKTLQRYNHKNLSVHEFILEMSSSESEWYYIPEFTTTDHDQPLFKSLKRLSLNSLHIKDETSTLEKIIRSCPLIEYLNVSGLTSIPATIFEAKFLTELHLTGCIFKKLIFTAPELILIKHLKKLSLILVNITEESLEKIMCSCPLIESLILTDCVGLRNILLIKNNNKLKHFSFSSCFYRGYAQSFDIHSPTIETIRIVDCPNWNGHDKYFFPRLKSLCLERVKLSAELFQSFSSNFPSLEDLQLVDCYGFQEIQEIKLTACSIKRLVIIADSTKPIRTTIYAPSIHYFKFSGRYPPKLIFYSGTNREWKSHVEIWFRNWFDSKALNLPWLLQLSELLNSLRESQISLVVHSDRFKNLKVEDAVFCKPVPLEDVHVKGGYESCSFPDLLNCLFLICRPRYIVINPVTDLKIEKDKLVEFITFKTIQNEGEMSRGGYLWERVLEEISMQVWDENSQGWHTVRVEGTSFPVFTSSDTKIRLPLKWRD